MGNNIVLTTVFDDIFEYPHIVAFKKTYYYFSRIIWCYSKMLSDFVVKMSLVSAPWDLHYDILVKS